MNWLDYKRNRGEMLNPFDEENGHVPAEVMPDYEPPPPPPQPQPMDVAPFPGNSPSQPPAPAESPVLSTDDLKRLLQPKTPQQPNPAVAEAFQRDKQKQNQDDLRMLLLAAGRREAPHLRDLGHPEAQFAMSQQPKEQDELARATQVAQLKKLLEGNKLEDAYKQAEINKINWEMMHPKPPPTDKPSAFTPLTDEQRVYWEGQTGKKLAPNATLEDVKTLQGSVVNPKASQGIAAAGVGLHAATVKAAADEKAAEQAGQTVVINGKAWSPPLGWKNDTAAKDIGDRARNGAVVVQSLDELDRLFDEAANNKTSPARRAAIESQVGLLAPQINVAVKQGAMSRDEYARVKESTGDVASSDFWLSGLKAAMGGGENVMKARIGVARRSFINAAEQTAKASNWAPSAAAPSPKTGKVLMRLGDDKQWVDPADVAAAAKDGYVEVKP